MRKLTSLLGNSQWLDGGAMFGNAPKAMWSKWINCDDDNRIPLACRALLIEEDDKNILLETGIGTFFEPKLRERFGIAEDHHVLLESLNKAGLGHEDIDIVILSHLHFDHAGGLLSAWEEGKESELLFPNAQYIVGKEAWNRATNPHPRDRASYIPRLIELLKKSGRLQIVDSEQSDLLGPDYRFHISNGHSPGMLLTEVTMPEGPVVFVADLVPGTPWIHLPITMGYDRFPEILIEEKTTLLNDLVERNGRLFYTHDHSTSLSGLTKDERGRFKVKDVHPTIVALEQ
jgi:glyoxylase-like metal-dependent hydrolase (beta-lactamase superfamily II)